MRTKDHLASTIANCPCCDSQLLGHLVALLASDVVDDDPAHLISFFDTIKRRDWKTVRSYQRWEALHDNVEVYGIRCSNRMALAIIRSPFDLYENDKPLAVDCLDQTESDQLLTLAKEINWQTVK